ncbi:unnamed protein product [Bursaphelenchus okinawaensis]|uniref:LRRCT domain-containing protein n=1 Tax=Bursaphelenchus okinawaensis TaxID=465554 RepID=A0A811KQY8_9BILA|nr:unnamed protein product [Bursaphelenchus okinawaensis]CAG9107823.1 unnamed protein product [Bursaphelenchus okinawaensis]
MRLVLVVQLLVLTGLVLGIKHRNFKRLGEYEDDSDLDYSEEEDDRDAEIEPLIVCRKDGKDPCHCDDKNDVGILNCRRGTTKKGKQSNKAFLTNATVKVEDDDFKAKHISFAGNQITFLDGESIVPGQRITVKTLDFTANRISLINTETFDEFSKLEKLKLSHNLIALDSTKDGWITDKLGKTLKKLYLDYNMLGDIPNGLFDPLGTTLETLVLDGNPSLKLSDNTFGSELANLKELSLDKCKLTDLPPKLFDNLKGLQSISLIGNPMTSIPASIAKISNLIYLDLSVTELPEIPADSFTKNSKLETIYLNNNKYLAKIDDCAFCELENLKKVIINNCEQLNHINKNAFGYVEGSGPKELTVLKLDNNNLTTLDEGLAKWEDLEGIALGKNPWICDDKLEWMIKTPGLHLIGDEVPKCNAPSELAGKSIPQLRGQAGTPEASPTSNSFFASAFYALLTIVLLSGIVVAGFIMWTKRHSNPFYRPTMPNVGFSNLTAELDMDDEMMTLADEDEEALPKPVAV